MLYILVIHGCFALGLCKYLYGLNNLGLLNPEEKSITGQPLPWVRVRLNALNFGGAGGVSVPSFHFS